MIRKIEKGQQLSESEIEKINNIFDDYLENKISLDYILEYFDVRHFINYYWKFGKTLIHEKLSEQQCAIAFLFEFHLDKLLIYNDLSRWFGLKDYVKRIFSIDVPVSLPPITCPKVRQGGRNV
jgi:hypothetical protein